MMNNTYVYFHQFLCYLYMTLLLLYYLGILTYYVLLEVHQKFRSSNKQRDKIIINKLRRTKRRTKTTLLLTLVSWGKNLGRKDLQSGNKVLININTHTPLLPYIQSRRKVSKKQITRELKNNYSQLVTVSKQCERLREGQQIAQLY